MEKQRQISGWILSIFIGLLLIMSGISKFTSQEITDAFVRYQLEDWQIIIGIGEIISAVLFILPKTNGFGGLLLSAFFGGTIIVHMIYDEPFFQQVAMLLIVWITVYIRAPFIKQKQF